MRLREIEDKIADDLPLAHAIAKDDQALARSALTELQLAVDTNVLRARMGAQPLKVDQFPFVVGRKPHVGEKAPKRVPDLVFDDRQPFRLSRQHFMISRTPNGFAVRDLNSALGTTVNGEPIGSQFRTDIAELKSGRNEIMAGGFGSDFAFSAFVR
jgi:CRP/FNR family cyclic AMP-dependent transcriptional regulator